MKNNFGIMRVSLALMVIISHSYMLILELNADPFLARFHTISLGATAVLGFFLISGYLIIASLQSSISLWHYFKKRILRIHPAYIVCYLLCLFALVPILGGSIQDIPTLKAIAFGLALKVPPDVPGVHEKLNGSMWTISYEFRCYVALAVFSAIGLLRNRQTFLLATIVLINAYLYGSFFDWSNASLLGSICQNTKMLSVFCVGACHWLYRDKITYSFKYALPCMVIAIALFPVPYLTDPALTLFGGYFLFWFAFTPKLKLLNSIGRKTDISYGAYLYGWPVQTILLHFWHTSVWKHAIVAIILASLCGLISWVCIERPFLRLKNK